MKTKRLFIYCLLAGTFLLASCSNEDMTDNQVEALPEGMYPLQIASVSVTAESSAESWGADAPQSRVAENTTNGNSSVWTNGDIITVQIGNDDTSTGTYKVNVNAGNNVTGLTAETALYWKNKTPQKVKGWYSTGTKYYGTTYKILLSNQGVNGAGLAYALYGETTANYQTITPIKLSFSHQLAKVRIVLDGSGKNDVTDVKVFTYPACYFTPNEEINVYVDPEYIPMKQVSYDNNQTYCWEANVVPGYEINKVKVNNMECMLTPPVTPEAANCYKVTIEVQQSSVRSVR